MPYPAKNAVHIRLLNGPHVTVGNEDSVQLPTRYAAALFTLLALKPHQPISRDDIADTLWPDEPLEASRRRIREHLYQLRKAIPHGRELILGEGDTIRLSDAFSISVDALDFDRLVKQASETEDPDRKTSLLVEADALYTGTFTPDLDWPRFDALRRRYADLHVELLRALSLLFAECDFDRAIEYGKRAVAGDPLCESAHEELIRLYARAGRPEEARRQYRELEKMLKEQLLTEPSREITAFIRGIPAVGPTRPIPRLLAGLRIAMPSRRAMRVYKVVAVLSLTAAISTLLVSRPWQRSQAQQPPLTPEQRIAIVQDLRTAAPGTETDKERAEHCLALAEEAWKAWWGPDEQVWIDRLGTIDGDIQKSLEWLSNYDRPREIQMCGALARYWQLRDPNGLELQKNRTWLAFSTDRDVRVQDAIRARALTGLSLSYLMSGSSERAKPGLKIALEAHNLYRRHEDVWGQAHALRYVALHRHYQVDNVGALRDFRTALDLFTQLGDEPGQAQTYECMTYIEPAESSGTMTVTEHLSLAIAASRLYRKIKNQRGMVESERALLDIARRPPASSGIQKELENVEGEFREWLDLAVSRNDLAKQRMIWIALATTALTIDDQPTLAECLLPLLQTMPFKMPYKRQTTEYDGLVAGAYMQYRALDPNTAERNDALQRVIASGEAAVGRSRWNAYVERGRQMSLHQAVNFAMGP